MKNKTITYFKTKQGVLPMFISDFLDICDPVLTFDEFMEGINLSKYLKNLPEDDTGRIRYSPVNILKTVLFGFMTQGYMSLRELEDIFKDINQKIFDDEKVDLDYLYIDGSKFEANPNKYSWVWKKATEKSRYRLYEKITLLLEEINHDLIWSGLTVSVNAEYVPDQLKEILFHFSRIWKIDENCFIYGKGHHKTSQQR